MKKNIIYIAIAWMFLVMNSCENYDDLIPSQYHKILSIKDTGELDLTLYNTGEDGVYSLTVMKGGSVAEISAQAEISVMSEAELNAYSEDVGKAYNLLPSSLYEIIDPTVSIGTKEKYQIKDISFKTSDIHGLLKEDASNYVLPVVLWSKTDSVNAEKNLVLIKPSVVIPQVSYEVGSATVTVEGNSVSYEFRLTLPFESLWDFECTVEIDQNSIPSGYNLIPNDLYTIANEGKVTFKEGESSSEPLVVEIKNADYFGNSYVIPLKVSSTTMQGFDLPESPFMLYGAFNKIPLTVDMLSTNAQETSEGPIANLVDNNSATYFHSAWSYAISDPHYFQINFGKSISKYQFVYQNRNNANGKPQEVKIMVSSNGVDWREAAHIDSGLPIDASSIYTSDIFTSEQGFSYFRFVVYKTNSGTAPTFFNMAEFSLFGK